MARRSFRNRMGTYRHQFRQHARVIIKRVRSRRRQLSFLQKNKTMILVGLAGGLAWIFRDKIKALLPK